VNTMLLQTFQMNRVLGELWHPKVAKVKKGKTRKSQFIFRTEGNQWAVGWAINHALHGLL